VPVRPTGRHALVALALALVAALGAPVLAGCGRARSGDDRPRDGDGSQRTPVLGRGGEEEKAAQDLGFPAFATKNTTRVGGADAVANAAAIARAVFPAQSAATRPGAVVLADGRDWRVGLAAAVLGGAPIRAPTLLSDGRDLPRASSDALDALAPTGARAAGGAQVIRVGDVARPEGLRTTDLAGRDAFALARAVDAFHSAARGGASRRVLVVSADSPAYAVPAAGWAAKAGDPVLFVTRDGLPADTRAALRSHQRPDIFVLGPPAAVSEAVMGGLRGLGTVTRIGASGPVASAIAFARYAEGGFGWGVVDPGHGLVFARADRPLDAVAAASLSAHGSYGPLLLVGGAQRLDAALEEYLLDIRPGYRSDPVRGVYNHGWIVGDDRALGLAAQARIDELLEIAPVTDPAAQQRQSP
jgi:putative cell wall binding repeat protein